MELSTVKHVRNILLVVMIITVILGMLAGDGAPVLRLVWAIIGFACIIAELVIHILFWRCPYCGKPLRYTVIKHCEHCGEVVEVE